MQSPPGFRQLCNDRIEFAGTTYRCGSDLPKACIHPLLTPRGHCLTGFQMSDHVWHRGIWFTIKYINGRNFWEEPESGNPADADGFGAHSSAGTPVCDVLSAEEARVTHDVNWVSREEGRVIAEHRLLTIRPGSTDWETELRATKDLELERTPYTTWGGYGGLSFRSSRELHDVSFLIPGGETTAALAGQRHDWCAMLASVDGGPKRRVSIAILDHPTNPRSPSPWYCKGANGFNYMNAAFLFHEGMKLERGESLRFRYRIVYRDGESTTDELSRLAGEWRETEASR